MMSMLLPMEMKICNNYNRNHAVKLVFADGSTLCTYLFFAADGAQSICRYLLAQPQVQYTSTAVTCLMGLAAKAVPGAAAERCFWHFALQRPIIILMRTVYRRNLFSNSHSRSTTQADF
jgi:2-polyprenyl-6-methoxyphenol hydroxylase-like FAD-dependent oxidoreductase